MSESKKILVIRSKGHLSKQKLKEFQKIWNTQLENGLVVIPNDFEFVALDPETLESCEWKWVQAEKPTLWQRLKRRFKHVCDK